MTWLTVCLTVACLTCVWWNRNANWINQVSVLPVYWFAFHLSFKCVCSLKYIFTCEVYFPEFYMRNSSDYVLGYEYLQNVCDLHKSAWKLLL